MFIKIIGDDNIIINGVNYNYKKRSGLVLIDNFEDYKIIRSVEYMLATNEQSKPLTDPPSFRDIRANGRTIGVIYMQDEGIYIAATSPRLCELKIDFFSHERLAKHFILTEGIEAPEIDTPNKNKAYLRQLRRVYPGCFNMIYNGHSFAGFTFNHDHNSIEAFNMSYGRQVFNNYHSAEQWVLSERYNMLS